MKPYNILIVDNDVNDQNTVIEILEKSNSNYNLLRSLSARQGLVIAERILPDLIITDWYMPEISGIEFIKNLKSKETTKNILVIMCTGVMTSSENLQLAFEVGAVDFVKKPIDKVELVARVRSMLQLADNIRENKELIESKDKLFSIIAHDLRSPFSALKGLTEVLQQKYSTFSKEKLENWLKIINQSVDKTYNLLENLLQWSRTQLNKVIFSPIPLYLHGIILETVEIYENIAFRKNIEIKISVEKDIYILADESMLRVVFRNLISNALKFTHKGGEIEISAIINLEVVEISIKDNGIGISHSNLTNLFKIGEIFSTFGTEGENGSGLGLILCYEFLKKHSSELKVSSEQNKGSKFCFSLPLVKKI